MVDDAGGLRLAGCPDKSNMKRLFVGLYVFGEDGLMEAIGFAYLSFGMVSIYGVVETAF